MKYKCILFLPGYLKAQVISLCRVRTKSSEPLNPEELSGVSILGS